jgi:hypothetical protein
MYAGEDGPQILDCSWQPLSYARRATDTVVLFDRAGIPLLEPADSPAIEARLEEAASQVSSFWMMVTVVAKYIARRDNWAVLSLLSSLWTALREVEWLTGRRSKQVTYRDRPDFASPVTTKAQLAALRRLMADMEALMQDVPALLVGIVPDLTEQVGQFVALVEAQIGSSQGGNAKG